MLLSTYTIKQRRQRGFSIFEILITAAIIGIITALIIFKYGSFNNSVLIKSQAYELAIDIRETQVFAVSALGDSSTFREEYGMYFDIDTPNVYAPFLDDGLTYGEDNPARYNTGEEVGQPYQIDSRFEIVKICVNNCSSDVNDLSVTFKRPDFDAKFASDDGSAPSQILSARIEISNVSGVSATRAVIITSTGQIRVE